MSDGSPRRPKRQSSSKMKKLELLSKMRDSIKGGKKLKYEVGNLENVYEEVDEKEYSRKVLERQEADWIVDDDGCGYVEDGREIFDDDLDEVSVEKSKREAVGKKRSRSAIEPLSDGKKGNIRNMLVSMPAKKKKEMSVKLDEDNLLVDIIGEIDGIKTTPKSTPIRSSSSSNVLKSVEKEISARDYMQSFSIKRSKIIEKKVLNDQFQGNSSKLDIKNCSPTVVKRSSVEQEIKEESEFIDYGDNRIDDDDEEDEIKSSTNTAIKDKSLDEMKQENMDICEPANTSSADLFENITSEDLGDIIDQVSRENTPGKPPIDSLKSKDEIEPIKKPSAAASLSFPCESNSPKPKSKIFISDDWDESPSNESPSVNIHIDTKSSLPLTKAANGENVFRFYYWDAHEELSKPGSVFLFGKTYIESAKAYVSCCVTVNNINRRVFILPRENKVSLFDQSESSQPVSMLDVYDEFNTKIAEKFKIESFKSRKSFKKYPFGKEDVPLESEYLEVHYSAKYPALPKDLQGETFSCIFGTKTSFLEILILDRGLKGPGWIDIKNAEPNSVPISWCKIEVNCSKPSDVVRLSLDERNDIPPVVSLTMAPYFIYNSKSHQSEIVSVACLVNNSYPVNKPPPNKLFNQHFCVVTRPSDIPWPYDLKETLQKGTRTRLEKMESERALLSYLLTMIYKIDPDIIVGHDLANFSIDILVDRLGALKVPNWSRLGRLRRANIPKGKAKFQIERVALTGRLLCDIKLSAKEFIKSRSYDLDTLCQNVLNFSENDRPEMNEDLFRHSYSSGESLVNALWSLMSDASYMLRIFAKLNVLPLALQISNIAGNIMSRTLMGGRAERNEYLLLHAFHDKDYIVPDKEYKKSVKGDGDDIEGAGVGKRANKKKPAYTGGLVLEPKIGLYDDNILLVDFNSLYPSIIQEFNICFTTLNVSLIKTDDEDLMAYLHKVAPNNAPPGILPIEIRKLVESRREVKNILKKNQNLSPEMRMQYDIRQMALKLTANSMYGCLGFSHSRFYAKPLAAIVAEKGREILMTTKTLVESQGYTIIYGDTDSLMINSGTKEYDKVFQIGRKIIAEVNRNYKVVELDIDGVFKKMLLLKKKKYAAVTMSKLPNGEIIEKKEIKGLDMVRRDWSQLSSEIGKKILDEILKDQSCDDRLEAIHSCLELVKEELLQNKVPINLLAITKQLTRAPENYANPKDLPHVLVALRLNQASARRFKMGDTVSYVICEDGTTNATKLRAYHIDELKNSENGLKVDTQYYLSQQIHPVIARLCDPIEGTDAVIIARCLGLDPTSYQNKAKFMSNDEKENPDLLFGENDSERYKDCERFSFICQNESCKIENVVEGPTRKLENGMYIVRLEKCINPSCNADPLSRLAYLQNSIREKIYSHIEKFYEGWLYCEDSFCGFRKRGLESMNFSGAYPECSLCHNSHLRREVTSFQLYNQLNYYSQLFDLTKLTASKKTRIADETKEAYAILFNTVNEILKRSSYFNVNLDSLFSSIFSSFSLKK